MRVVHPFYPPGTSAQERELVTANGIYLYPYVPERQEDHPGVFKTPAPVDEATQEHLKERLKEETGNTIEFMGVIKPELIGGFVLRIGNTRIDASYARQLREIRNQLIEKN